MQLDFGAVLHAISGIMTFVIVGFVGYILAKKNWFTVESTRLLSRLVLSVSVPVYLGYNVLTSLPKEGLGEFITYLVPPLLSIFGNLVVGFLLFRLFRVPEEKRGVFITSIAYSNTIFIGLPINLVLFGEAALPHVLLYYMANTLLFWTVGNYLLTPAEQRATTRIFSISTLRKIVTPPIIGAAIGFVLLVTNIQLPSILADSARMLGSLTTPLVLLSLGIAVYGTNLDMKKIDFPMLLIIIGRFVISPILIICLAHLFALPSLMTKVFIIQSSLPAMTSITMVDLFYNADSKYSAIVISVTTLLAIITVPVFMGLISAFF